MSRQELPSHVPPMKGVRCRALAVRCATLLLASGLIAVVGPNLPRAAAAPRNPAAANGPAANGPAAKDPARAKIAAAASQAAVATAPDFEHRIRPIILRHCSGCHNPSERTSGLNLLKRADALVGGESGEPAIKPGDVDDSYIITRIEAGEMPPLGKGKAPSPAEVATLKSWIKAGAAWPKGRVLNQFEMTTDTRAGRDWWSLQRPIRPKVPAVKNAAWVRNPIDAFVLAKLEANGLHPAPEADRATLIRRAKLDLLGLPPSPEEIQAFVADKSPDAYEKLVDRYLASPHYGERWARHWLDVARFAESNGFETNVARTDAWPYRDYVIRVFNTDKPYTQFITEQLAGDKVGAGVATGFLVAGPVDIVKSPNVELTRTQRLGELNDMVSTTTTAFLGMTSGCAKCHDHKFDPISQHDYYALQCVFSGVQHGERRIDDAHSKQRLERRAALTQKIAALDRSRRTIAARYAPLAQLVDAGNHAKLLRPAVSALGNVDRFSPVIAKYLRFTIRATNGAEPCIDELEIFSAESTPRNVALASTGAIATASGVYLNGAYPLHQLAHINDGRYGNPRSWISNEVGRGWVQIALPKPVLIDRVEWARDREGAFGDRLAVNYTIEVAVERGKWQTVATSGDRQPYSAQADSAQANSAEPSREGLPADAADKLDALDANIHSLRGELAMLQPRMVYAGRFVQPSEPTYLLSRGDPMQRREPVRPGAIAAVGKPLDLPMNTPEAARRWRWPAGSPTRAIRSRLG